MTFLPLGYAWRVPEQIVGLGHVYAQTLSPICLSEILPVESRKWGEGSCWLYFRQYLGNPCIDYGHGCYQTAMKGLIVSVRFGASGSVFVHHHNQVQELALGSSFPCNNHPIRYLN